VRPADLARARAAAARIAGAHGVAADEARVLSNSNAVVLRLLPGNTVARVAPAGRQNAAFQIEVAQRLAERGAPVVRLDPRVPARVHEDDGFVLTFWTHHEAVPGPVPPQEFADALRRLHGASVDLAAPSYTDRAAHAEELLLDPSRTPDLPAAERSLLLSVVRTPLVGDQQLLHGEPHVANVLHTADGVLFLDFETCCRGPVEFDVAHVPEAVAHHYPGLDADRLRASRILMFALIVTWRWDRDDQFPNGMSRAAEWTRKLGSLLA